MKRSVIRTWLVAGAAILVIGPVAVSQAEEHQEGADITAFGALESLPSETLGETRGRDMNFHLEQVEVTSAQELQAIARESAFIVIGGEEASMRTGNITYEKGSMGHYSGTGIFNNVTGNANAVNNAIGISVYINNP